MLPKLTRNLLLMNTNITQLQSYRYITKPIQLLVQEIFQANGYLSEVILSTE